MDKVSRYCLDWLSSKDLPERFLEALLAVVWPDVAGNRLAPVTRVGSLRNGRLCILVRSRTWQVELEGIREMLLERVGQVIPRDRIRELHIRSAPSRFPTGTVDREQSPRRSDRHPAWKDRCLADISNPRLRQVVDDAMSAHLARHPAAGSVNRSG